MAQIDEVRERYESITEQLYKNRDTFAEYLKFAGKFFKMPTAQTIAMFAANPKATMVADYDTWRKFGRQVMRGTNSIAVLDGSGLKHYFDISQTSGGKPPYQWTLNKQTAQEFIAAFSKAEGKEYKSMSGCVNAIGRTAAADNLENAIKALNISETDRAAFEKSFVSITQYFIAARCELGGRFDYKNNPMDLSAFDLVHSKAEAEKLTEYVQIAARPALLSMEKTINSLIAERSIDNARDKTDFVYLEQVELGLTDEEQKLMSEPIDRWGKAWQKFMTENYPEEIPSLEGRLKWELIPRQIDKEAWEMWELLRKQYAEKNPRPKTTFTEIEQWEKTRSFIVEHEVMEQIVLVHRG